VSSPDALAYAAQVRARLTGPGGPFELRTESVRGNDLPVYVNRAPSLRSLFDASLAFGDREYLVDEHTRLTYAQHHDSVLSLATALADRFGVGRLDRVMVLAANSPQWVQALVPLHSGQGIVLASTWTGFPHEEHTGEFLSMSRPQCGHTGYAMFASSSVSQVAAALAWF